MDVRATLAEAQSALAEARRQVTAYELIVKALKDLEGDGADLKITDRDGAVSMVEAKSPGRIYLKPKEAVLRVMRAHPNVHVTPKDVFEWIREEDLFNPNIASGPNAYATALRRLSLDGKTPLEVTPSGRYVYMTTMGLLDQSLEYAALPPKFAGVQSTAEAQ
jgi:hypothetical protein